MITSFPIESSIQFVEVTEVTPLISKCVIKVCYVGQTPNRNGSVITKEVATEMAKSLPGCPIVGYYNETTHDFEGHEGTFVEDENGVWSWKELTRPYGFVPTDAKVWFEKFMDEDIEHEYLVTEGWLWTGAYPETSRVLVRGNNHSMELSQVAWTEVNDSFTSFFIINDALISKLCILGEDVEPCFEGSQIKDHFSLDVDEFKTQIFTLINDIKEELLKGGNSAMENNEVISTNTVEEPVTEMELEVTKTPEVQEPVTEKETPIINMEEPEVETVLKADYEAVVQELNELKETYSALENEVNTLREFKSNVDTAEKNTMIDNFWMLTDEDKKDVRENINKYSVEEIKSKLAVICYDKKVNFSTVQVEEKPLTEELEIPVAPTTYNLNSNPTTTGADVPDWVQAIKDYNASQM